MGLFYIAKTLVYSFYPARDYYACIVQSTSGIVWLPIFYNTERHTLRRSTLVIFG